MSVFLGRIGTNLKSIDRTKHAYAHAHRHARRNRNGCLWELLHLSRLIVGAPMGNDTSQGYKARFGGVYKCDLKARNQACDIMTNFDSVDKGRG